MILDLDDNELDYLFKVLSQRPWVEVYPIMGKLCKQIQEQENARSPADAASNGGPTEESPDG